MESVLTNDRGMNGEPGANKAQSADHLRTMRPPHWREIARNLLHTKQEGIARARRWGNRYAARLDLQECRRIRALLRSETA